MLITFNTYKHILSVYLYTLVIYDSFLFETFSRYAIVFSKSKIKRETEYRKQKSFKWVSQRNSSSCLLVTKFMYCSFLVFRKNLTWKRNFYPSPTRQGDYNFYFHHSLFCRVRLLSLVSSKFVFESFFTDQRTCFIF